MTQKVGKDVAQSEFERFVTAMALDISTDGMSPDDIRSLEKTQKTFLDAVMNGSLVVNDKGEPVFTPVASSPSSAITFAEPTGAALIARDQKKKDHDVEKSIATLAQMTNEPEARYRAMPNRDLRVCTSIMLLFLA